VKKLLETHVSLYKCYTLLRVERNFDRARDDEVRGIAGGAKLKISWNVHRLPSRSCSRIYLSSFDFLCCPWLSANKFSKTNFTYLCKFKSFL